MENTTNITVATLAGGCFWCTEAVFLDLKGVIKIMPGYLGGHTDKPTYKEICTGTTGHAEAIEITYDANILSFAELLEVFFATHDPTTLNRQGNDVGTQYRSAIFYHDEEQHATASHFITILNKEQVFGKDVVTEVVPVTVFYPAEDYHVNYYNQNKEQAYCSFVIKPKMDKLHKLFQERLKV